MTQSDNDFFDNLLVASKRPTCDAIIFEILKSKLGKLYKTSNCDEMSQKLYEEFTNKKGVFVLEEKIFGSQKSIILSRFNQSGKTMVYTICITNNEITKIG